MENRLKNKSLLCFIVLFNLSFMLGCKTMYKVEQNLTLYSPEQINSFISGETLSSNDLSEVSRDINKALLKDGTNLTIDTLSFNSHNHNALLKKYSKSGDSKTGYFVII